MIFRPLLASSCDDLSALRYPFLASQKLDGIRCVKIGGRALTRKLKEVPNNFVRRWVETHLPDGIDGELLLRDHRTPFNEVSSAIMSEDGEPDFVFAAFDLLDIYGVSEALPFEQRLRRIHDMVDSRTDPILQHFYVVPHILVNNLDELQRVIARHLEEGYEGTMLRDPNGRYKFGRSTLKEQILLKVKPFADEEATITGVVEQMHNTNEATIDALGRTKRSSAKAGKVGKGMLGAFTCRTEDGALFEVGTGFTDDERKKIWRRYKDQFGGPCGQVCRNTWPIGNVIKFKHQPPPGGRKPGEAPRFPVFLGWRAD